MPGNRRTVRASVCVARAFEPSGAGFGNDEEGGAATGGGTARTCPPPHWRDVCRGGATGCARPRPSPQPRAGLRCTHLQAAEPRFELGDARADRVQVGVVRREFVAAGRHAHEGVLHGHDAALRHQTADAGGGGGSRGRAAGLLGLMAPLDLRQALGIVAAEFGVEEFQVLISR